MDLSDKKLQLDYPCNWIYKLIVKEDTKIKKLVKDILHNREYKIKESNSSKKGKFKSYALELLVHNEDDRKEIFQILSEEKDIKMIV